MGMSSGSARQVQRSASLTYGDGSYAGRPLSAEKMSAPADSFSNRGGTPPVGRPLAGATEAYVAGGYDKRWATGRVATDTPRRPGRGYDCTAVSNFVRTGLRSRTSRNLVAPSPCRHAR